MVNQYSPNTKTISAEEINLGEILKALLDRKFFIMASIILSTSISILYSFNLANTYTTSVLLAPSDDDTKSSMLGQMGGLAGLAGVSLGDGAVNKTDEAIERIKTYEFFSKHFLPNVKLKNLMAVSNWNKGKNSIVYDDRIYNSNNDQWVRKSRIPFINISKVPSTQEAFIRYKELLHIEQDRKTSFVSILVSHESPYKAKEWADLILSKINQSMRDQEKSKTIKSLDFLNDQYSQTDYKEIRQSIASLQEEQMKSLMMLEASESFVFKILDYPIVPEKKSAPKRSIIILLGTIFGFMISSLVAIFQFYKPANIKIKNQKP